MSATRESARYRFGPANSLGVVGNARLSQCLTVLGGIAGTLASMYALPLVLAPAAFLPLAAATIVAFLPLRGLVALDWVRLAVAHGAARIGGRTRWRIPRDGRPVADDEGPIPLPSTWGRLRIIASPHRGVPIGVLVDDQAGTATGTVLVRVESFALLNEADQERRVAAWGATLGALARDSHPVRRIGWTERTVPAEIDEIAAFFAGERRAGLDAPGVLSYVELIDSSSAAALEHECFVSVQIDARARRREVRQRAASIGSEDGALAAIVVDELRLVASAIEEAGIGVVGALPPRLLAAAIRHAVDPATRPHLARLAAAGAQEGCAPGQAGPMAAEEHWDCVRMDAAWHATFWISRWPLRDVGCLFLSPLINRTEAIRSVGLAAEPIPPGRAHREAEHAVVREEGDQVTRERHGFLQTARQRRRHEGVLDREHELADGHALVRFAGHVTVTAPSRDELEAACAEVVQAAQHSHLELRRLYGEQLDTLANTLPGLCRGLA